MNDLEKTKKIEQLIDDLKCFNIVLNEEKVNQFLLYYELLIEWNSFINLTAITDFSEILKKHFVDSISLVNAVSDLSENDYKLVDVGTGAGFPGIPLKIVFPDLEITLLDSLNKRVKFLNEVITKLNLKKINTIHGRAEDYAKPEKLREKFDICVSRAVANMTVLSEYCIPFVKEKGYFVAYKSDKAEEEFNNSKNAVKILGGEYDKQVEFYLPSSDIYRNLWVIRKKYKTPLKYPRKAGIPLKEPLK